MPFSPRVAFGRPDVVSVSANPPYPLPGKFLLALTASIGTLILCG
jgi:hypothetical protein